MTQWWSYRPSDLLMFSPRTFYRLFELTNVQVWPAQLFTVGLGLAIVVAWWQRRSAVYALGFAVLGFVWAWVGIGYFARQLASVHTAAGWCAGAFALQGVLLVLAEATVSARQSVPAPRGRARVIGLALMLWALLLHPWVGLLFGQPWRQAEVFGIAPDPTVVATFGLLAMSAGLPPRWLYRCLWVVPLLWCVIGSITLWTMGSPQALLMPLAAVMALWGARQPRD